MTFSTDVVGLDYETRSRCDLKTAGAALYARHETTDILCLSATYMAQGCTARPVTWSPFQKGDTANRAASATIRDMLTNAKMVVAHNAAFDRDIHKFVGAPLYALPEIPDDRWYCTSAQARVNALPANLDDATRCINAKHRKNFIGDRVLRKLSVPQKDGQFHMDADTLRDCMRYCEDDVLAMKALFHAARFMTDQEYDDWLLNEKINERGIMIDEQLAELALKYAGAETEQIGAELTELTAGAVTRHTQTARVKTWMQGREDLNDDLRAEFKTYKDGEEKFSLAKDIRERVLVKADEGLLDVPDAVYNVIAALDDGNKSSVSKFKRMLERADPADGVVRGAFVYAGASQTLRFASRGLQLHNLRRDCWSPQETEQLIDGMEKGHPIPDPMDTLSKALRPALIPDGGNVFMVADWSSIEARALPWLSNSTGGNKKLNLFRSGEDVYKHAAAPIFGKDPSEIDKDSRERQIGKVAELSLGYGGAKGAFSAMARNYGVALPESEVQRIVDRWRSANSWCVKFWAELESAAMRAMRSPGDGYVAGRVAYRFDRALLGGTLICTLPGGTTIQYPSAKIEHVETPYGTKPQITAIKAGWKPKADEKEWPRVRLWPGLLAENITQAFCAALLRWALAELDRRFEKEDREALKAFLCAHVHDEIVAECAREAAFNTCEIMRDVMNEPPEWAAGLPLAAEPATMSRYGK